MFTVPTKYFDEIQVDETKLIYFDDGIPGFEDQHKFTIVASEDLEDLNFLQSVEDPEVCFVLMYPALLVGDYNIEITDDIVKKLDIKVAEDVGVYTVMNLGENLKDSTANLKAPIIVNFENHKGIQGMLEDTNFGIKEKVFARH